MPLSDARSDIDFPPKLQLVLNNALARSAAERYQNAADFGHDTLDAVAGMKMPETRVQVAHEGATHIMSKDELTQATKAQSASPKKKAAAGDARRTAPTAAPPAAKKSNTGLIVGGGVGAVAVIAAVAVIMMKGGQGAGTADTLTTRQGGQQLTLNPPPDTTGPGPGTQKTAANTTTKQQVSNQTHFPPVDTSKRIGTNPPPAVANWADTIAAYNTAFDNDELGTARQRAMAVFNSPAGAVSSQQRASAAIMVATTYSGSNTERAAEWYRKGLTYATPAQRTNIEGAMRVLGVEP
jgi:hypothetical protein